MGVREHLGRNMGEHRAGLEKGNAKADTAEIGGRLPGHTEQARVREQEDVKSDDCGVLVRRGSGDGMGAEESRRNTGSPRKQSIKAQRGIPRGTGLACVGGGEARSSEDTRNERRAKGPQFQGNATSGARAEIGASLPPAEKLLKLQETLHGETRTSGLMSGGVETGPLKDTAPPLDSTRFLLNGYNCLDNKELWGSAKYSLFLRCCSAETSKRQAREAVLSLRSAWSRARARSRRGSRSVLPRIASRICETSGLGALFRGGDQMLLSQVSFDDNWRRFSNCGTSHALGTETCGLADFAREGTIAQGIPET